MQKMKILADARIWQILLVAFFMSQTCRSAAIEEAPCSKPADIYFVLDASGSIWGPDFKKQLAFVNTVIGELQLDPEVVRCGLITYGDIVKHEFSLNKYAGRKRETSLAVTAVKQLRGDTRTDKALERMRELMLAEAREGVPRIAIVMTDGQSNYPKLTKKEAELTHKMGITTFAIGIGKKVDERELESLASHEDYMFTVDNFDALSAVRIMLSTKACDVQFVPPPVEIQNIEGCKYGPADIIFVLDSSSSVWIADFSRLLGFVEDLVELMSISSDDLRFGVLTYGSTPKDQILLDQYTTTSALTKAITAIAKQGGGTNTAAALRHLRQVFKAAGKGREDVEKIAILVTDGPSDSTRATAQQAEHLHSDGIRVFAIGVGKDAYLEELEQIAAQPSKDNVFTVDAYNGLRSIMPRLASKMCKLDVAALNRGDDIDIEWGRVKTAPILSTTTTTTRPRATARITARPTTPRPTTTPTTTTTTTTPPPPPPPTTTAARATLPPRGCGEVKPADIVFALPATSTTHQTNDAIDFIRSVADRMMVSPKGVHIGLAPRGCLSVPGFTLDQGSDKNQVLRMFDVGQKSNLQAKTDSVIKYLRSVSFRPESGARPNARKIGVLIVDRPLKNFDKAVDESILAKRDDIDLVVIGVGKEVSVEELTMLASAKSPHHYSVMTVPCYSQLKRLTRRLVHTADQFCTAD